MRRRPCDEYEWADRLQLVMNERGIGQIRLANHVGLSLSMVRNVRGGRSHGSTETQAAIADALEEDPGWLFPRTEREKIRAEMFRRTRRPSGLEVAHYYPFPCEDMADL